MDTIVRNIADDAPSPLLGFFAAKAVDMLAWKIKSEREYPFRTVLRKRLEKLAAAIEAVRKEMLDLDMSGLLLGNDAKFLNENETHYGLNDLAERVKRTANCVPKGPGRYKYSPGAMTPQQACALMIIELWKSVHHREPSMANPDAQEACRDLWKAAGGRVAKLAARKIGEKIRLPRDASTEGWHDQLQAAKRLAQSPEAERIRRSLSLDFDGSLGRAASRLVERPRKRGSGSVLYD